MLSTQGALFVGAFEGFRAECYDDAPRDGNCTIGYGHLVHLGPTTPEDRARLGTWTRAHGLAVLQADAARAAAAVAATVRVRLTQEQRDALISFAFNCGTGSLGGAVGRAVNTKPHFWRRAAIHGWHQRVQDALLLWDHFHGSVNQGLERRRLAEARLFSAGKYTRDTGNPYANS